MKMKNVFYAVLLMVVSQTSFATMFTVVNRTNDVMEVDPVWSGNPRGYFHLNGQDKRSFNSGLHHLLRIYVKYSNGSCLYYDLENSNIGRAKIGVTINILNGGQCSIDLGRGEGMPIQGVRCNQ